MALYVGVADLTGLMAASFYGPGAFSSANQWVDLDDLAGPAAKDAPPLLLAPASELVPAAAALALATPAPRPASVHIALVGVATSAVVAPTPAPALTPALTSAPVPALLAATGCSAGASFSSFYPGKGPISSAVSGKGTLLPWMRRGSAADDGDERERRHRSSWHAALNKRLVAIEDAEELLALVAQELSGFDVLNTVTVLNRLSRLPGSRKMQRDHRALEILYRLEAWLTRASAHDSEMDGPEAVLPKHLASISTGLARLQWKDSTAGRVLRMIMALAPGVLPLARARDLSNLAWSFATLNVRGFDSVLLAIARESVAQIADFNEQNLSNTCWAFAKIGLRHDPLIKAIADETLRKLPQFSAQGLSNTLWGYATLVIKGEECLGKSAWKLVCALLEELIARLPGCPTQQLSNSAWACCRLGVRHDDFMAAIASEGMRKLPNYTTQDLANTSMAFAKTNINNREFLRALAGEAARKMRDFEAREVSNITWSLNIMGPGIIGPEWLDPALAHFAGLVKLDDVEARRDGDFEGWEMVQLLNACWSHRAQLKQWPGLARTFRERIYGPVVRALAVVVGRGAAPRTETYNGNHASLTLEDEAPTRRLFNAGPKTSGALAAAARPPAPSDPLDAARQAAQDIVERLEVDFLGPVFTRSALRELGFVDSSDQRTLDAFGVEGGDEAAIAAPAWGARARAAVAAALTEMRAELPFLWFDRFGPHERRVQCWIAYELEVEVGAGSGPVRASLAEPGRIANFSLDEHRAMCQHGCETFARLDAEKSGGVLFTLDDVRRAQRWISGLFAQHDRVGHCERQALLEVVLEAIGTIRHLQKTTADCAPTVDKCVSDGFFDGSNDVCVRGKIQMFVCHFFCISCIAAISNFARRFPYVEIHTDYDDCWKTRLLDV